MRSGRTAKRTIRPLPRWAIGLLALWLAAAQPSPAEPNGKSAGAHKCHYYFSKVVEIARHPEMAVRWGPFSVARRFHKALNQSTTEKRPVYVALKDIHPNHALDTAEARAKTRQRAEAIRAVRPDLDASGFLDFEAQTKLIPSNQFIKVTRDGYGNLIVIEGVGRYFALKEAFSDNPDFPVQVLFVDHGGNRHVTDLLDRHLRNRGFWIGPNHPSPTLWDAPPPQGLTTVGSMP